jgi:hypothetical protein
MRSAAEKGTFVRNEAGRVVMRPDGNVRGGRGRRAAAVAAALLLASLVGTPPATAQEGDDLEPRPIKAVILVDESGSLSEADIAAERVATLAIVQSEFARDSEMSVVGFGSDNGVQGQSAVNVVCQPITVADGPNRDQLSDCVGKLHRRTDREGNDTDFAAAVGQGLSLLGSEPYAGPESPAKLIFLLTDGTLDVGRSPRYGELPAKRRNDAAQSMLDDYLGRASEAGIQIWPLGFGDAIDKDSLDVFAAAGSQVTCNPDAPKPKARVVDDADDVTRSFLDAYTGARCAGGGDTDTDDLGGGSSVELTVQIPEITTDGAIAVVKRDARVTVEYRDPSGTVVPKAGAVGGTSYQVSGESGPVEVLLVRNPSPGKWTVRLTSPPGVPAQRVAATAIWQGVVRAVIAVDPPMPEAGKQATVSVRLQTRSGAITDPDVLRPLRVAVELTGDGFAPVVGRLADDGKGADSTAGDGQYAGSVTVPSTATGSLTFLGSVSGPGVGADRRPLQTRITQGAPPVRVQVRLDGRRVAPGEALSGTLEATNGSADPVTLRLLLSDPAPGTLPGGVTPATVTVPASGSTSPDIKISIAAESSEGAGQLRLQVVDDTRRDVIYKDELLGLDISEPPFLPPWLTLLLVSVAAILLVVLLVYAVLFVRRRLGERVKGLTVLLLGVPGDRPPFLDAKEQPPSREFWFRIEDEDGDVPRLRHAGQGDPEAFVARRDGQGAITVVAPGGTTVRVTVDTPQPLPSGGLLLGMRDGGGDRVGRTQRIGQHVTDDGPQDSVRDVDFENDLI